MELTVISNEYWLQDSQFKIYISTIKIKLNQKHKICSAIGSCFKKKKDEK